MCKTMQIKDLSKKKIGILKTKHAESVTLSSDGTKAYIADGTSGLVIADISLSLIHI